MHVDSFSVHAQRKQEYLFLNKDNQEWKKQKSIPKRKGVHKMNKASLQVSMWKVISDFNIFCPMDNELSFKVGSGHCNSTKSNACFSSPPWIFLWGTDVGTISWNPVTDFMDTPYPNRVGECCSSELRASWET